MMRKKIEGVCDGRRFSVETRLLGWQDTCAVSSAKERRSGGTYKGLN